MSSSQRNTRIAVTTHSRAATRTNMSIRRTSSGVHAAYAHLVGAANPLEQWTVADSLCATEWALARNPHLRPCVAVFGSVAALACYQSACGSRWTGWPPLMPREPADVDIICCSRALASFASALQMACADVHKRRHPGDCSTRFRAEMRAELTNRCDHGWTTADTAAGLPLTCLVRNHYVVNMTDCVTCVSRQILDIVTLDERVSRVPRAVDRQLAIQTMTFVAPCVGDADLAAMYAKSIVVADRGKCERTVRWLDRAIRGASPERVSMRPSPMSVVVDAADRAELASFACGPCVRELYRLCAPVRHDDVHEARSVAASTAQHAAGGGSMGPRGTGSQDEGSTSTVTAPVKPETASAAHVGEHAVAADEADVPARPHGAALEELASALSASVADKKAAESRAAVAETTVRDVEALLSSARSRARETEEELKEVRAKHKTEVDELRAEHKAELERLREEHKAETAVLKRTYQERSREMAQAHAKSVAKVNEIHEKRTNAHAREIAQVREATEAKNRTLAARAISLQQQIDACQTEMVVARKESDKITADLRAEVKSLRKRMRKCAATLKKTEGVLEETKHTLYMEKNLHQSGAFSMNKKLQELRAELGRQTSYVNALKSELQQRRADGMKLSAQLRTLVRVVFEHADAATTVTPSSTFGEHSDGQARGCGTGDDVRREADNGRRTHDGKDVRASNGGGDDRTGAECTVMHATGTYDRVMQWTRALSESLPNGQLRECLTCRKHTLEILRAKAFCRDVLAYLDHFEVSFDTIEDRDAVAAWSEYCPDIDAASVIETDVESLDVDAAMSGQDKSAILQRLYPAGSTAAAHCQRYFCRGDHWFLRDIPAYKFACKGKDDPFHVMLRASLHTMVSSGLLSAANADDIPNPPVSPMHAECAPLLREVLADVEEGGDCAETHIIKLFTDQLRVELDLARDIMRAADTLPVLEGKAKHIRASAFSALHQDFLQRPEIVMMPFLQKDMKALPPAFVCAVQMASMASAYIAMERAYMSKCRSQALTFLKGTLNPGSRDVDSGSRRATLRALNLAALKSPYPQYMYPYDAQARIDTRAWTSFDETRADVRRFPSGPKEDADADTDAGTDTGSDADADAGADGGDCDIDGDDARAGGGGVGGVGADSGGAGAGGGGAGAGGGGAGGGGLKQTLVRDVIGACVSAACAMPTADAGCGPSACADMTQTLTISTHAPHAKRRTRTRRKRRR